SSASASCCRATCPTPSARRRAATSTPAARSPNPTARNACPSCGRASPGTGCRAITGGRPRHSSGASFVDPREDRATGVASPQRSALRREALEVVDADHLFDLGHLLGDLLEAVAAQVLAFALLHLVAHLLELLGRQQMAQGGEKVGLLARRMRAVHGGE